MEEEREPNAKYLTGFNDGYTIASCFPDLARMMQSELAPVTSYYEGLLEGTTEYFQSQEKTQEEELDSIRREKSEPDLER